MGRKRELNIRHNLIVSCHTAICNRASIPASNEPPLRDASGKRLRPDGCQSFMEGTHLTDVTVRHSCSASYIQKKQDWRKVAEGAKRVKVNRYARKDGQGQPVPASVAALEGADFTALCIDSHGAMHADFCGFLRKVTREAVLNGICDPDLYAQYYSNLCTEIGVCLIKGNALAARGFIRRARLQSAKVVRSHRAAAA